MESKQTNLYHDLVNQYHADPSFKKKLLSNPIETLQSFGITVKDGVEIKVLEDNETVRHLRIPKTSNEVGDEDLLTVAGGAPGQVWNDGGVHHIKGGGDFSGSYTGPNDVVIFN